ncbi:MAG: hypothetical protein ACLFTV_05310, partial [Desulfococcaceae bacterium]
MTEDVRPASRNKGPLILAGIGLLVLVAVAIYLIFRFDLLSRSVQYLDEDMPNWLFLVLIAILPIFGAPFSPFLILAGIKFGAVGGLALLMALMPFQILVSYGIANLLNRQLRQIFERFGYRVPQIPENRAALFSFIWLAIPGAPYAMKNFALPLAGAPFRHCLWMNWALQGAYGAGFVVLGRSAADMNLWIFLLALALLGGAFGLIKWVRERYGREM